MWRFSVAIYVKYVTSSRPTLRHSPYFNFMTSLYTRFIYMYFEICFVALQSNFQRYCYCIMSPMPLFDFSFHYTFNNIYNNCRKILQYLWNGMSALKELKPENLHRWDLSYFLVWSWNWSKLLIDKWTKQGCLKLKLFSPSYDIVRILRFIPDF
jgi:hypothetical protein